MTIVAGQIGYGRWGKILYRYFQHHQGFEIRKVAACDPNKNRPGLRRNVELTTSIEPILNDREIEAVVIATPLETHYPLAKAVLESGKHLFIEKPIALRGQEARNLKEISERKQVRILVDFTFTFSAALAQMRQLIEQGEIGEVSAIQMAMCNNQPWAQEDVYYELGSHMLGLLSLFYQLENFDFDHFDIEQNNQKTQEGIIGFFPKHKISFGTIYLNFAYPGKERTVVFVGEKKVKLTYDAQRLPHLFLTDNLKTKRFGQFFEGDNLKFAVQAFYELILGRADLSNIDLAILVSDILEKIKK
jgi:predicted dehydrogenase